MWKNILQPGRPHMTIWRMRFTWCMPKAKISPSKYVTFIAFQKPQRLHERTSVLRYTYIACLFHNQKCVCLLRGTNQRLIYNLNKFRFNSVNEYITDFCRGEFDMRRIWIELNRIWVRGLPAPLHLGLKTGALYPMFCTKLEEPCSFNKVPDGPYALIPNILTVQKRNSDMYTCMSEWG